MLCKDYEKLVVDYLAGELKQGQKEMLMEHLNKCPSCSALFKEYRFIISKSKMINIPVPESDILEKKLFEIKAIEPHRIRVLKPVIAMVSLLFLVSLFFVRITDNGKDRLVIREHGKNGYEIVLTQLPYSESTIREYIEYIDDDSASEILKIVLDTPAFLPYEY